MIQRRDNIDRHQYVVLNDWVVCHRRRYSMRIGTKGSNGRSKNPGEVVSLREILY